MLSNDTPSNGNNWQKEADLYLKKGNYIKAAALYEKAINISPNQKSNYWKLGLTLLLQGQEEEAQTTWLIGMSDGEPEQIEQWTTELLQVLETEANQRATVEEYSVAWAIRQHIREINPSDLNNLLQLIDLSITLKTDAGNQLTEYGLVTKLQSQESLDVNPALMLHILKKLLVDDPINPASLDFAQVCISHVGEQRDFVTNLIPILYDIAYSFGEVEVARRYAEFFLELAPDHQELLRTISQFCIDLTEYRDGIDYAKRCYSITSVLYQKVFDNNLILRALMAEGGCTDEVKDVMKNQESLLDSLFQNPPENLRDVAMRMYNSSFFFPYARDRPEENITLRNKVAKICQDNLQTHRADECAKYRSRILQKRQKSDFNQPLKIGYLSHCFRRHSVGWIARWLFKYHDRDNFEIYAYLLGAENRQDPMQNWYVKQASQSYQYGIVSGEVAEQIYQDEIDILIDLDSITLTNSAWITALKPAPVQVTWLGWDTSGIPTIDHFIADPYVLPDNAQDYYQEKIWRLPQTYVAVDGFEVATPSLRREDLNIADNAVVYLSAQRGPKYNPETSKLQIQILKEVPNSYLIIKGFGEQESINNLFFELAEEQGIDRDRLRFIDRVGLEETHRANLAIADVVLDTYPYNGATTTLETLWMGIPIVTRVGEQFAARNSYTMMINAGITEGIAWTDEEYVEWGVRLGNDEKIRQEISWKLRKSKQTAPLWNGKQFTREMENAYQQMWKQYLES